ncbi:MAG: hypothetical protein AB7O57_01540 [Hyphomicrobiaceae bacterium]
MTVLTFTDDAGNKLPLEASTIVRVRGVVESEKTMSHPPRLNVSTRIDGAFTAYVREAPTVVAASIKTVIATFDSLQLPDRRRGDVWLDAKDATGPVPTSPTNRPDGARSALVIGNMLQYVHNTPEEVHDLLEKHGGKALPLPQPSIMSAERAQESVQGWLAPKGVWDAELPGS